MNADEANEISKQVIGASYCVSNQLGAGFLEKVYENALTLELRKNGLFVQQQRSINVYYDDKIVGEYYVDLLVENFLVIELKASKILNTNHQAQLMNYLKASKLQVGLLINFGRPRVEIKRIVNNFKS